MKRISKACCLVFLAATMIGNLDAQTLPLVPGDRVEISLADAPNNVRDVVSGSYQISPDGKLIGVPYLAPEGIAAQGLTMEQLAETVTRAMVETKSLTSGRVEISARPIDVGGRVTRPGAVPYREGMTALEVFMEAGGADKFGQKKRVRLFQNGKRVRVLDLSKDSDQILTMEPGDRLEVVAKNAWEH